MNKINKIQTIQKKIIVIKKPFYKITIYHLNNIGKTNKNHLIKMPITKNRCLLAFKNNKLLKQ